MHSFQTVSIVAGLSALVLGAATSSSSALPIVDLGYERHQAIAYNVNIRRVQRSRKILTLQSQPSGFTTSQTLDLLHHR